LSIKDTSFSTQKNIFYCKW